MNVSRIISPEGMAAPGVLRLIGRAVEATSYPGTEPKAFVAELWSRLADRSLGIFIGRNGRARPEMVCVAVLPTSAMMMAPQVALVYNEGSPELCREVGAALSAWVRGEGYSTVLGLNLWREDEVFMRGFRHFGEPKRIGSMIEFKLELP